MNRTKIMAGGVILALAGCKIYRIASNKKQYLSNIRIHHYQIGIIVLAGGLLRNNPLLVGIGSGLVLDDLPDFIRDGNNLFKRLNDIKIKI